MSMTNPGALVLILNETTLPRLTLMSVANPCSVGSPAPWTSHSLWGLPARLFSTTIGLLVDCASRVGRMEPPAAANSATALSAPNNRIADRRGKAVDLFLLGLLRG